MKIAALKERTKGESRVAITPETARLYVKKGYDVFVEKNIGIAANFVDQEYINAGANVSAIPLEIISDADIILKVQPSPIIDEINEIDLAKNGAVIIGMLSPHSNNQYIDKSFSKKLSTIAMELMPRISKAQNMDVLSSQSNMAGYRAVIEASYHYDGILPTIMSAAGTIKSPKLLVIGAGVAGLQAIATAKRLGANVRAYDVRPETKEQIESLGAKFVQNGDEPDLFKEIVVDSDIIITTAQLLGKEAPLLLDKGMVARMRPGSIIVDLATADGGNVEDSVADKVIMKKGVKIIGWTNMATRVAHDSSKLYAKNLYNFLEYAIKDEQIDFADELVEEVLIGKEGQVLNKKFKV